MKNTLKAIPAVLALSSTPDIVYQNNQTWCMKQDQFRMQMMQIMKCYPDCSENQITTLEVINEKRKAMKALCDGEYSI